MNTTLSISAEAASAIHAQFVRLCEANPSAAALICAATGIATSRAQLRARAAELETLFRSSGLSSGQSVAVQLPNGIDFVAAFIAARQLGLTFVPLDRDAKQSEVAAVLQHFAINALVYQPGASDQLPSLIVRSNAADERLRGAALVKLTSGSTGRPKGILTSEANLIADCTNICTTMQIAPDDVNFGAIPFSHSYGFSNLVTPLLTQGTAIVYSNDYLPLAVLDACNRYGVTVMPGIPLIYEHLARLPQSDGVFDSVRTFISAGAPLGATTSRKFRERYENSIHTFYGCSECGGISYDREGGAVERGTVGSAMDGVTLSIEAGQGRLVVESAAAAMSYFDPSGEECRKFSESRFVTDDIVEIDEHGLLRITGRIGELINTAGKKVNPREVEAVVLQLAGVQQVKAYGEPAGARGDVVAVAVVADPDVSREMIRTFCRSRLSAHKVPRIIKLIEAIPVDERGKVKRSALAAL